MADDKERPIIIKKVKKVAGGHHGGAWKVAYADFVTAMMAFFLLMWLLGATTEDQRKGIAEYFDPIAVSASQSGSGGVLEGKTMSESGNLIEQEPSSAVQSQTPGEQGNAESPPMGKEEDLENLSDKTPEDPGAGQQGTTGEQSGMTAEEMREKAAQEEAKLQATKAKLVEAIQSSPDLAGLTKNLIVDETPEGLRIQIIDTDGRPMFQSGSSVMGDSLRVILTNVIAAIRDMPNKISIRGHTDGTPFRGGGRDNWDLSAERANASRREVVALGISPDRIANVVGRADREPLLPDAPNDPQNRRIGIILMREYPKAIAPVPAAEPKPPAPAQ